MKKAPKWVNVLLWGIVAIRLICPVFMKSELSLIPNTETIPMDIELDTTPTIHTGIYILNNVVNPIISQVNVPINGTSVNPLQITISLLWNIWIAGIVILLLYTIFSYWRLHQMIHTAVLYKKHIFQSEYVTTPFVCRKKAYYSNPFESFSSDVISSGPLILKQNKIQMEEPSPHS